MSFLPTAMVGFPMCICTRGQFFLLETRVEIMAQKRQLSVGVSMFYQRDNIHPSASSVLSSCLLLLLSQTKLPCCCKRMRVLLLVTGCAAKILPGPQGSFPYPWQSLHCLGAEQQARAAERKREPKSLQWKGLLKPVGFLWAPGTDGSWPWRQIQSHTCGLRSALRSCGIS